MAGARGNYAKGRARRAEIIGIALELFVRQGYDRTSVREIARLSGLSQAGLLHYFGTKEELFLEVLKLRDRRNERFHETDEKLTLDGLTNVVDHNAVESGLVRLYVTLSAESTAEESGLRPYFADRFDSLRAELATDIRQRQQAGELTSTLDPESFAAILIAAADGLQIQWLLSPEKIDMGARLADLGALLSVVPGSLPLGGDGQGTGEEGQGLIDPQEAGRPVEVAVQHP